MSSNEDEQKDIQVAKIQAVRQTIIQYMRGMKVREGDTFPFMVKMTIVERTVNRGVDCGLSDVDLALEELSVEGFYEKKDTAYYLTAQGARVLYG